MNNDTSGINETVEIKNVGTGETTKAPTNDLATLASMTSITFADVADFCAISQGSSLADVTRIYAARLEEFMKVLVNPEASDEQRIVALAYCLGTDTIWKAMLGELDTRARIEMLSTIKAKKLNVK